MKIHIHSTYQAMSAAVAAYVADYIRQHPEALICLPSGETPVGTFERLILLAQRGEADFRRCHFVGLDEWVGMDRSDEGSCQDYLYRQVFDPLGIRPEQITLFNAKAPDLEAECRRMDAYLQQCGPIDLMLVGLGMNGHIGLNEPGASFSQHAHCTVLDPLTRQVAQKYFSRPTELDGGITLGLGQLMEARHVLLMASGAKKADIVARAVEGEVSRQVPASIVQTHPGAQIFLDEAAASGLQKASQHPKDA